MLFPNDEEFTAARAKAALLTLHRWVDWQDANALAKVFAPAGYLKSVSLSFNADEDCTLEMEFDVKKMECDVTGMPIELLRLIRQYGGRYCRHNVTVETPVKRVGEYFISGYARMSVTVHVFPPRARRFGDEAAFADVFSFNPVHGRYYPTAS